MKSVTIKNPIYLFAIAIIIITSSCSPSADSEYSKLVKKELAKNKREDSLFMGIYLGMPSKAFYDHCWDLNKKGIFTNGLMNNTVLYSMDKDLPYPANMNFYPDFYEGKISVMKVAYDYKGWAPWNKAQYSDSLLQDVLNMYRKWYPGGNDFIKMTNKDRGTIYVKVDGNRRITVGRYDERLVKVDYTDLLVEEKIKAAQSKK
jgi:hypothetical protein